MSERVPTTEQDQLRCLVCKSPVADGGTCCNVQMSWAPTTEPMRCSFCGAQGVETRGYMGLWLCTNQLACMAERASHPPASNPSELPKGSVSPTTEQEAEQRIAEIRERLKAATPGPWYVDATCTEDLAIRFTVDEDDDELADAVQAENPGCLVAIVPPQKADHDVHEPDAELIANAPSDIAFLLSENAHIKMLFDERARAVETGAQAILDVRRLQSENARLRRDGDAMLNGDAFADMAQFRKDAERLDWLDDSQLALCEPENGDEEIIDAVRLFNAGTFDLREAIDAAMSRQSSPAEGQGNG